MKWEILSEAKGKERKKLHELQTALSFTRLELGRDHGFDAYGYAKRNGKELQPVPQARKWITQLKEYKAFTGMEYYNESALWNRLLYKGMGTIPTFFRHQEKLVFQAQSFSNS